MQFHVVDAVRCQIFSREGVEFRDDLHAVDEGRALGEQRRHVAAAAADFQHPVRRLHTEILQHAGFQLGLQHHFAVPQRDFHVHEGE